MALRMDEERPLVLTVPGLGNSGPGHWQSLWEERRTDCRRVDLGMWDQPHRNTWVNQLNLAIRDAGRPVVLVAHSLGCLAVAWWAALERPGADGPVRAAMLVAPPRVDDRPRDPRIAPFAPAPRAALPFASLLVASRDDPYMTHTEARRLAADWGSRFVDAGRCGHINAQSGLGDWPIGQYLLDQYLLDRVLLKGDGNSAPAPARSPVLRPASRSALRP